MATYARVDELRLKALLREGVKYAEIAERLGVSYSSVAHHARKLGYGRSLADHSAALPWKLAEQHRLSPPAQYLRDLSRVSQGLTVEVYRRSCAIRWAQRLVANNYDIAYKADVPPNDFCADGGFHRIPAGSDNPLETHVGRILHSAMERLQPPE